MSARLQLEGKRFGRLTVIKPTWKNGRKHYLCKCVCGNKIATIRYSLQHKLTQSCGCLSREIASKILSKRDKRKDKNPSFKNLEGFRSGRLTVTNKYKFIKESSGKNASWWECICDCGNIVWKRGNSLACIRTKSCGCLLRETSSRHLQKLALTRIGSKNLQYKDGLCSERKAAKNFFGYTPNKEELQAWLEIQKIRKEKKLALSQFQLLR